MKKKEKIYLVYGNESGDIKEFKTLKEAKIFIKQLKEFDKENNIEDTYYIEILESERWRNEKNKTWKHINNNRCHSNGNNIYMWYK